MVSQWVHSWVSLKEGHRKGFDDLWVRKRCTYCAKSLCARVRVCVCVCVCVCACVCVYHTWNNRDVLQTEIHEIFRKQAGTWPGPGCENWWPHIWKFATKVRAEGFPRMVKSRASIFVKLGGADVCTRAHLRPLLWKHKLADFSQWFERRFTTLITPRCLSVCAHCLLSPVEPSPWPSCSLSSPTASPSPLLTPAALYSASSSPNFPRLASKGPLGSIWQEMMDPYLLYLDMAQTGPTTSVDENPPWKGI